MATFYHREPRLSILTICPLPDRSGLILAGEADLTVQDMLRAALATLPAAGQIRLDLARLRFIDLACTRELITLTARHPAVRLIICHPPAELLRIIELAYPDATLEFTGTPSPHSPPARQNQATRGDGQDSTSTPDRSPAPRSPTPGRAISGPAASARRQDPAAPGRNQRLDNPSPKVA